MPAPTSPITEQRPCTGLRSAHHDTVQPLAMCQDCRLWLNGQRHLPPVAPRIRVQVAQQLVECLDRIQS